MLIKSGVQIMFLLKAERELSTPHQLMVKKISTLVKNTEFQFFTFWMNMENILTVNLPVKMCGNLTNR